MTTRMTADALKAAYTQGRRDFRGWRLARADLRGSKLHAAMLSYRRLR